MDGIKGLPESIRSIKGLGPAKLGSLMDAVGGQEKLIRYLDDGDIARISAVEGISEKMAVSMVLRYRGSESCELFGTPGARDIYEDIIDIIKKYMSTGNGKNRACLLVPMNDLDAMSVRSKEIWTLKDLAAGKDRERVMSLLSAAGRFVHRSRERRSLNYIVMAEDEKALDMIRKKRLDTRCLVITPDEYSASLDEELIIVYSEGRLEMDEVPAVARVHMDSEDHEIIPEVVLDGLSENRESIKALAELEDIFSKDGVASDMLSLIDEMSSLSAEKMDPDEIRSTVEKIRVDVEDSLREAVSGITLSGDEALSLMAREGPGPLSDIFRDHSSMALELVGSHIGIKEDLFEMGYPLKVDEDALERAINKIRERSGEEAFLRKSGISREIASMKEDLIKEVEWALDLDYDFGLGSMVLDLDLNPFEPSEGWVGLYRAGHLSIRGDPSFQAVTYHLGSVPEKERSSFPGSDISVSRSALLTGANSGGKTTLLENIAQMVIMARMGLPVPAKKAFVPDIGSLFLYRPRRKLDAGGLEAFLTEFLPLTMDVDERSMVLADELEAMTELEAASRMIGFFMDRVKERGAFSLIVTHMADGIRARTECRIDGIEAKGLSEEHELIVDRTPVVGRQARSTPELILKKLEARSRGEERKVYGELLRSFE